MIYRDFGKTGWKVSAIGLGTWNIGNQWGNVDDSTAYATIRKSLDCGVNLFDTAESYGIPNGLSEERLGRALSGNRHQVHIVTKVGHWGDRSGQKVPKNTTDMIRLCAHACLHRLRTDWVDVLLCHEGTLEDPSIYLESFELLKKEGKVRAYGISTDRLEVLKKFNAHQTCSVVETGYSLLRREPEKEFFPYCQEHGIAILLKTPLAQGVLSGRYSSSTVFTDTVRSKWHQDPKRQENFQKQAGLAEKLLQGLPPKSNLIHWALQFAFSHPSHPVALPGAKSPEQAAMNAEAGHRSLTPAEREKLISLLPAS